jgi:hypothetical protein
MFQQLDLGGWMVKGVGLGLLDTGIMGSYFIQGMDICLHLPVLLSCVGKGLVTG